MRRLSDKQKAVLRLSGWTEERIDAACFDSFGAAWQEVGDALAEHRRRMSRRQVLAFAELGEHGIAAALQAQRGDPWGRQDDFEKPAPAPVPADYDAYLASDLWLDRRDDYEAKFPRRCYVCGTSQDCQLHHTSYARIGRERDEDLEWLCRRHHREIHRDGEVPLPDEGALERMRIEYRNNSGVASRK